MIRPLPNPACFPAILKAVNGARSSVVVVNYIAEFSDRVKKDPVAVLASALVRAKKRGVGVAVILEGSRFKDNYPFYRYLKDKGVDVWLDTSITLIHHKAVLVDDEVLISGSHNWSYAAFFKNEEFSMMTDDKRTVEVFKKELLKITGQREGLRAIRSKGAVELPVHFMEKVVFPLFRVHAEHAFNLYMLLVGEDGGCPRPLPLREEEWGGALGFDPAKAGKGVKENYRRYYYAQRLNRVLSQLKRFGLIEVDRRNDTVVRSSLREPVRHSERSEGSRGQFSIPIELWSYGWLSRLSFPAKTFYLVSLMKTSDSPFHPWWSSSIKALTKEFGLANTIDDGIHELESCNVLEVLRGIPVKRGRFYSEEAHYYRTNPLYDMDAFAQRLARLERRFSKRTVQRSVAAAKGFWASRNIDALEAVASLIARHGWPKVRRAAGTLARLPASSSRRCLAYLEELLHVDK